MHTGTPPEGRAPGKGPLAARRGRAQVWPCPGVCRCGLASYIRPGRQARAGLPLTARKWRCQAQPEGVEQAQRPAAGWAGWPLPPVGAPPLTAQAWSSQKWQHAPLCPPAESQEFPPAGPLPTFLPLPRGHCPSPAARELFLRPTAQHASTSSGSEVSLRPVRQAACSGPAEQPGA